MKTAKKATTQKTTKSRSAQPGKPSTARTKVEDSSKPTPESAVQKQPEVPEGKPVMQHDLKGFALICLPAQMRQILGEEAYEECIRQIQDVALVLIVRELEKVLFVDLAWRIAEPGADGLQLRPVKVGDASADKATVKTKTAKARAKTASGKS